jgi:DNA end-binding protein Ku
MPRPIWSGSISFGLVNVPVNAFSAVRDHTVHIHQLEKGTGSRIKYAKVSGKTGKRVANDDIEKGYEISKGHYVVVDPDELDELRPRSTRAIDVTDFVELSEVDPIYYENTYWLAPDGESADRAYRLLYAAMEDAERVAIGSVVMRNKQYLAAIRPLDGALAMSTMRFADEVLDRREIEGIPTSRVKPSEKELRLAEQIVDSLSSEWDPSRYHDTYTEQLRELIDAKAEGKEITAEEPAEAEGGKVIDLMAALEASVEQHKARRAAKKAPARRSAPKRKSA